MKDGIIKGTGNSRYLRGAGWPTTYEEFKSMAEAGTLPFELNGINEAGWQQIGDALNKANLLSDTTCDLLQIPHTSVVNDALIANHNYTETTTAELRAFVIKKTPTTFEKLITGRLI